MKTMECPTCNETWEAGKDGRCASCGGSERVDESGSGEPTCSRSFDSVAALVVETADTKQQVAEFFWLQRSELEERLKEARALAEKWRDRACSDGAPYLRDTLPWESPENAPNPAAGGLDS